MMYKASTLFIGALIAVMVSFNGILAGYTSSMFSVLVVHIVGITTVTLIVIFKREKKAAGGSRLPVIFFCAGIIGVLLTYLNNTCIVVLGVSLTLALGLVGQSVMSCIIDHFGLFGVDVSRFNRKKLFGFALCFAGVAVMVLF